MKTKRLIMIAVAFMAMGSAANAAEVPSTSVLTEMQQPMRQMQQMRQGMQQMQQGTRTVTAVYLGQGSINSLLIRVQGNHVVAYCSGRDYQGRQIWDDIEPVQIYKNNGGAVTSNAQAQSAISMKKFYARLGELTIYFD